MNVKLIESIKAIKEGNTKEYKNILDKFSPLMRKYSLYTNQEKEDTFQELSVFLVQLISKIPSNIQDDKQCFNYIYRCLKNEFIRLYKCYRLRIECLVMLNEDNIGVYKDDIIDKIGLFDLITKNLNDEEKELIEQLYFEQLTVKEISKKRNVSVQAIYQKRNKILLNLRNHL